MSIQHLDICAHTITFGMEWAQIQVSQVTSVSEIVAQWLKPFLCSIHYFFLPTIQMAFVLCPLTVYFPGSVEKMSVWQDLFWIKWCTPDCLPTGKSKHIPKTLQQHQSEKSTPLGTLTIIHRNQRKIAGWYMINHISFMNKFEPSRLISLKIKSVRIF